LLIIITVIVFHAGKYWLDNTQCGGQEMEISECRFDSWGENDCDPSEAAGVVCGSPEPEKPKYSVPVVTVSAKKVIQKYRIKVIAIIPFYSYLNLNHIKAFTVYIIEF